MHFEYFPLSLQELQKELYQHPPLVALLRQDPAPNKLVRFSEAIATIATYVNVAVDGDYDVKALDGLVFTLVKKLRAERALML